MDTQLVRYVRNRKGMLVGAVLAKKFPEMEHIYVSGSLCRVGKDTFNKDIAVALAEDRATVMAFEKRQCTVPLSLKKDIDYMVRRAKRYFRTEKVIGSAIKVPNGLDITNIPM